MKKMLCVPAMLLLAAAVSTAAWSAGTLEEVKKRGVVVVGVNEAAPPFGTHRPEAAGRTAREPLKDAPRRRAQTVRRRTGRSRRSARLENVRALHFGRLAFHRVLTSNATLQAMEAAA